MARVRAWPETNSAAAFDRSGVAPVSECGGTSPTGVCHLLEARRVLPLAQEPIGVQGRERKTSRIETCCSRPGKKSCPGPLIGRKAVSRKIDRPRALPSRFQEARLLYFPQARRHFTQLDLFCNNRSYCNGDESPGFTLHGLVSCQRLANDDAATGERKSRRIRKISHHLPRNP